MDERLSIDGYEDVAREEEATELGGTGTSIIKGGDCLDDDFALKNGEFESEGSVAYDFFLREGSHGGMM